MENHPRGNLIVSLSVQIPFKWTLPVVRQAANENNNTHKMLLARGISIFNLKTIISKFDRNYCCKIILLLFYQLLLPNYR